MRRGTLVCVLATLQLLGIAVACHLHVTEPEDTPVINKRKFSPGDTKKTAIEDVRVFNGLFFTPPKTICMNDGYIVPTHECHEAETTIKGDGKYLIPGLIDNHLHLKDVESLEKFTSYGCTTAFHTNCRNYTQCNIMANQPGLAAFIYAGRSAIGNGSHHERTDPTRPKDTFIYPDTNVAQFVQWQFNNSSDFHKITAELNGPSTEQQIEMVKVAHTQFQKQTFTHASEIAAYIQAAESLTDAIQHVPDDGILNNSTIRKIKAQNQYVTPTLNVFEYAYRDPLLQKYFGVTPGSNRTLEHAETNARLLYQTGIPILAGTDSVGRLELDGESTTVPWGLSLHYELENFVNKLGMSPAEAINSATREAARLHGIPDRGTIDIGKRADLLLLNSNPLSNITNTQDIEKIWVFGLEVKDVAKGS